MVRVSGPLRVVTDRPLLVSQVRVRAARDRAESGGLTAAFSDTVTVDGGRLDMVVLPGPAVLVLEVAGGFSHAVKLVVPDVETATLEQCVVAAEVADDADKRTLERLAGEVARDALAASGSAESAAGAASEAATQAQAAESSAGAAAESAKTAATSEAGAQGAQAAAAESARSAATSEENAASHAATAVQHEVAASGSAKSAGASADRAATIAGSTRWVGTKLEVNGQLSPDLKGERGEPGRDGTMTFEELTPAQRASLKGEKGEPGRDGKDGAPGTTTWAGITGKPVTFPPAPHTHPWDTITSRPLVSTRADGNTLVQRWPSGQISVPTTPDSDGAAASKYYVDGQVAGVVVQVSSAPTYPRTGVLYVIPE